MGKAKAVDLEGEHEEQEKVERKAPKKAPKEGKRREKRDPGRDETLSEYLAALGSIPLLTADEEKELARTLRDHEVASWAGLLTDAAVVRHLATHPIFEDKKFTPRATAARHVRRVARAKTEGLKDSPQIKKDIAEIAASLRDADEDRKVVEEAIEVLAEAMAEPGGGKREAKRRKALLDGVKRERRKALRIRNHFVRANLRLVVSVARRFHHYRMPLIDLIQEGNLGLIKSVHRFDHERGFRFSTYAHWWIRQAIERAIMNKGAQVRLPVHIFDARREVAKATHDLSQMLGRDPSKAELAEALGQPLERIEEILRAVPREPISLDDPVGDDEDRTVSETISDNDDDGPDERVISVEMASHVRHILRRLSPMEIDIIERRFGLIGDADETLEQIGKSYNLSRERVRQIQVQGLRKMQRFAERRQLAV